MPNRRQSTGAVIGSAHPIATRAVGISVEAASRTVSGGGADSSHRPSPIHRPETKHSDVCSLQPLRRFLYTSPRVGPEYDVPRTVLVGVPPAQRRREGPREDAACQPPPRQPPPVGVPSPTDGRRWRRRRPISLADGGGPPRPTARRSRRGSRHHLVPTGECETSPSRSWLASRTRAAQSKSHIKTMSARAQSYDRRSGPQMQWSVDAL